MRKLEDHGYRLGLILAAAAVVKALHATEKRMAKSLSKNKKK